MWKPSLDSHTYSIPLGSQHMYRRGAGFSSLRVLSQAGGLQCSREMSYAAQATFPENSLCHRTVFWLETGELQFINNGQKQDQRGSKPMACVWSPPLGVSSPQRLLNWMLALACQQGHLSIVKLLVLTHGADPESYAVRSNEFPVILRLPLYAAIKSGEWLPRAGQGLPMAWGSSYF